MSSGRSLMRASWLGRVPYRSTYELQRSLSARRKADDIPNTLLLLEHDHVITFGRRADETHLVESAGLIETRDVEVVDTDRGGEATYHGPGQLVAYPIINVRELKMGPVAYVRLLEETIIQVLAEHGIRGHRVVGKSGVWIAGEPGGRPEEGTNPTGRKIAAIGVRISGGIAMHGMALNVSTDLSYYSQIIPCGMPGLDMTSIARETREFVDTESVGKLWAEMFADILFFDVDWVSASSLSSVDIQSVQVPVSV